jgi:hypothetical protein
MDYSVRTKPQIGQHGAVQARAFTVKKSQEAHFFTFLDQLMCHLESYDATHTKTAQQIGSMGLDSA